MKYFRKTQVLPHGERQVLICTTDGLPPIYPNLYFAGVFNQAFQTKRRRADCIVNLLNWSHKLSIDLSERIRSGQGFLFSEMESLGYHLCIKKTDSPEIVEYVVQISYRERCREVLRYLKYLMRKFSDSRRDKQSYLDRVTSNLNDLSDVLTSNRSRDVQSLREGLTHTERKYMLEFADPQSSANPFQIRVRERNSLIIQLLLQTGIRVGELLALRCDCYFSDLDIDYGMQHFLKVDENIYLNEDPRNIPPEAKTNTRMIPISEGLAIMIDHYIKNNRLYRGREARKAPAFLFLNSNIKPKPLSYNALAAMLKRLETLVCEKRKIFASIFPHRLRYSFFESLARVMNLPQESEEYKKIMRYIGGWSPTSEQFRLYAMKQIRHSSHLGLQILHEEYNY